MHKVFFTGFIWDDSEKVHVCWTYLKSKHHEILTGLVLLSDLHDFLTCFKCN